MAFFNLTPSASTYVLEPTAPMTVRLGTPQSLQTVKEPDQGSLTIKEEIVHTIKEELEEEDFQPDSIEVPVKLEIDICEEAKTEEAYEDCNPPRKTHTCIHCSYSTNWKGNLTKHLVSRHTALEEIKWLQCEYCDYKGKTKDYLKCHLLHVHNVSVKWYNCGHCSFRSKMKSHLHRHIIINHTEAEEIQWLQCELCPYKGKFKTNLKQHMLSQHTNLSDVDWFRCDLCEFRAKRKRNLELHKLNKHTEDGKVPKWFICNFCPYKYKRKTALNFHIAKKHLQVKSKKVKPKTREIPVFIENKLCWKRVVVEADGKEDSLKCSQCCFETDDKEIFKKHVLKEHVVTELKKEDDCIVKKTFKTKDVIVMVDDVPCVKKIVDHELSQDGDVM